MKFWRKLKIKFLFKKLTQMRGLFCFKHFVVCVCLCYDEKKEVFVMWFDESVIYQIYPFAFVGAPEFNDGKTENRMQKFIDYIPHLKKLNVNAVYFCPIFESSRHGYDTKDFSKIDCRKIGILLSISI